tara:strand:+ start:155 stop:502 length:348 start_codon:yes stop_codon:yes gene_type:complete
MKYKFNIKKRLFKPTIHNKLSDMGYINLNNYEQITFKSGKKKNDVTKMPWGYYLANSLNGTLYKNGFKTALVLSNYQSSKKLFLNIVEIGKEKEFKKYLKLNEAKVLMWLNKIKL